MAKYDEEEDWEDDEEDEREEEKEERRGRPKADKNKSRKLPEKEEDKGPWQYYVQQAFTGLRNAKTNEFVTEPEVLRRILNLCEEIVKNTR